MSLEATFQQAIQHHQAGRLRQAEQLYRQVLQVRPEQPDTLHMLGVIAHQSGQNEQALQLIRRAIARKGDDAGFYSNLGVALRAMGRREEAVQAFRHAVRLKPESPAGHKNLAVTLREMGCGDEAERGLRHVLSLNPDDLGTIKMLGATLAQTGRLDEALKLFSDAAARHPGDREIRNNLGVVLKDLGRLREAETHLREAVRLGPDNAEAYNNLGLVLSLSRRHEEAIRTLRRAVSLAPKFVLARNNLGVALKDVGSLPEAVDELNEALRMQPDYVAALNNLGEALNSLGHPQEAERRLRRALELDPNCFEAHNNLGLTLNGMERQADGIPHLQRALELNPNYVPAHINTGNALVGKGDVEGGAKRFRTALDLDPENVEAFYSLASSTRTTFTDEEFQRLEALLRTRTSTNDQSLIHFALGQTLERMKEYDQAFPHAVEANRLKNITFRKQGLAFDPARHVQKVDRIIATCAEAYFEKVAGWGLESELPVFIVGMPRSSTTLVEQILCSHGAIHGAGELADIEMFVHDLPTTIGTATSYPDCLAEMSRDTTRSLAEKHLKRLHELGGDAVRVVDKMTVNFLHLGLIAAMFPKARIVHTRRDPRDICTSCFFHNFAQAGLAFAFDLEHIGVFYAQYERVMAHWRAALPLPILDVPYEQLVEDPEGWTRKLIDFCGLEWDANCLEFHKNERRVKTASALQVRQPIYKSSVQRWKRFGDSLKPFTDALERCGVRLDG